MFDPSRTASRNCLVIPNGLQFGVPGVGKRGTKRPYCRLALPKHAILFCHSFQATDNFVMYAHNREIAVCAHP